MAKVPFASATMCASLGGFRTRAIMPCPVQPYASPRGSTPWVSAAALVLLAACGGRELEVSATVNETTATVIELAWSTDQPGASWVEYGPTEAMGLQTPVSDPGTEHHFALFGLPPLSPVYYRAVTTVDDDELSAAGEAWTLNLPATLPDIEVTVHEPALTSAEPYMMGLLVGVSSAIFVVNRAGDVVWYRELDGVAGPKPPVYGDVQFALDGNDLVFNRFTADLDDPEGLNTILRVSLTGQVIDERSTPRSHHAFAQVGDGRYAYVAADVRSYQLPDAMEPADIVGDAIVVVDPDGGAETVFSTWDWTLPTTVTDPDLSLYGDMADWTHANGLAWYPEDGTFLLSAGYTQAVLEVERSSGRLLRHFGHDGDVPVAPGSTDFFFQHDPTWTDDGTLLMASAYLEGEGEREDSMFIAVEYAVEAGQLQEVWSYGKDQDIATLAEGQARRLANGNTMVNWGFTGLCREVTPAGQVVWQLEAAAGAAMVRVRPISSFYEGY